MPGSKLPASGRHYPKRESRSGTSPGRAGRWPAALDVWFKEVAGQRPAVPSANPGRGQALVEPAAGRLLSMPGSKRLPASGRHYPKRKPRPGTSPGRAGRWPAALDARFRRLPASGRHYPKREPRSGTSPGRAGRWPAALDARFMRLPASGRHYPKREPGRGQALAEPAAGRLLSMPGSKRLPASGRHYPKREPRSGTSPGRAGRWPATRCLVQ